MHHSALGEVLQHPKSKLVAAGVNITFHCQLADYLESYWVVNSTPGIPHNINKLQNSGFFVSQSSQDGITTLSLRVTATMDKNGTVVSCSSSQSIQTDTAVLVVIEGKSLLTTSRPLINLISTRLSVHGP